MEIPRHVQTLHGEITRGGLLDHSLLYFFESGFLNGPGRQGLARLADY